METLCSQHFICETSQAVSNKPAVVSICTSACQRERMRDGAITETSVSNKRNNQLDKLQIAFLISHAAIPSHRETTPNDITGT